MTVTALTCAVQQYAWGKPGKTSKVAEMVRDRIAIDDAKPYAEVAFHLYERHSKGAHLR